MLFKFCVFLPVKRKKRANGVEIINKTLKLRKKATNAAPKTLSYAPKPQNLRYYNSSDPKIWNVLSTLVLTTRKLSRACCATASRVQCSVTFLALKDVLVKTLRKIPKAVDDEWQWATVFIMIDYADLQTNITYLTTVNVTTSTSLTIACLIALERRKWKTSCIKSLFFRAVCQLVLTSTRPFTLPQH